MNIVKNDPSVKPASADQIALIKRVIEEYPLDDTIYLDETIHGHIAQFNFEDGYFIPLQKGTPARLDKDLLKFWSDIADDLRWFEISHGLIKIAF